MVNISKFWLPWNLSKGVQMGPCYSHVSYHNHIICKYSDLVSSLSVSFLFRLKDIWYHHHLYHSYSQRYLVSSSSVSLTGGFEVSGYMFWYICGVTFGIIYHIWVHIWYYHHHLCHWRVDLRCLGIWVVLHLVSCIIFGYIFGIIFWYIFGIIIISVIDGWVWGVWVYGSRFSPFTCSSLCPIPLHNMRNTRHTI